MADHKRQANFQDENLIEKRARSTNSDFDIEKKNDTAESCTPNCQERLDEINGKQQINNENKIIKNGDKDPQMCEPNSSLEDVHLLCNSVAPEHVKKLTSLEADAAEDKGSRHTMEDASVILLDASIDYPGILRCAHFAVYDGHGGRLAVEYAQKHLHKNVLAAGLPRELMDVKVAKKAILEGFRRTDETLLQESAKGNWSDGATAVCVWILDQMVLVANIGDAKAVLARSSTTEDSQTSSNGPGSPLKAIVVTREHKAIYPQERTRIQKAGGSVGPNGRLQGRLEVSRAFGDRQFKKVGVIATPDVHSFDLTEREHFMILGCDGLWGVFGPSDAVDFVQKQLKETSSASIAARRLVREAIRERRCKDNCTAVVIVFRHK